MMKMSLPVEVLARLIHEAGREAVEMGATVAADHHGESAREFLKWDDISENAREGRRIQARALLEVLDISKKDTDWVVATRLLRYFGPEWLVRSALDHSIHGVKILGNGLTIREDRVEVVKVRDGEEEETVSGEEVSHTPMEDRKDFKVSKYVKCEYVDKAYSERTEFFWGGKPGWYFYDERKYELIGPVKTREECKDRASIYAKGGDVQCR